MKKIIVSLLMLLSVSIVSAAEVADLRCEYRANPLGIDVTTPRLSWVIEESNQRSAISGQDSEVRSQNREARSLKTDDRKLTTQPRGLKQTAYQIVVASSEELLKSDKGDLWDSGKVDSDLQNQISYSGKALNSRSQCFWKARAWINGSPTNWSSTASWSMGLLKPEDWQANWIGTVAKQATTPNYIGYHALEASQETDEKWVQVDLGKTMPIEAVVLHSLNHGGTNSLDNSFGFPVRFRIEVSDDTDFKTSKMITDQTSADYPNPGHVAVPFEARGLTARYVRVTATKLWNRQSGGNPFCLALAQMEVISAGKNTALKAAVTAKDSVENWGWAMASLTDGQRFSPQNSKPPEGDAVDLKPSEAIHLRKEFTLAKEVRRAEISICGLGFYELHLNGQKVGDRVLDPGWTNYKQSCLYTTYDVKSLLAKGDNAIGIILGNGMYNIPGGRYTKFTGSFGLPQAIVRLDVEYKDGTSKVISSDNTWSWAQGPVRFTCIYGGEDYDARKELPGWDKPGYRATGFKPVVLTEGPGGKLTSQAAPPIKVMQEYKAVKISEPKSGIRVYDFGQNCASMPRITVKGSAGTSIKMTPGELLQPNGFVSQGSSGGPAYYTYTLKGDEIENWSPRFFYYGSRYLQVETSGHDNGNAPEILELTSQFVHSSAKTVGTFTCSNPLVNQIHSLITAAIKSNLQSVLTDCPHREKLGWLECSHLLAGCLMYNYDVPTFYAKIANDMAEAQLQNGMVPDIAPEYIVFGGGFRDSPEWGSAYVITPWQVYQMYGDKTVLMRHYEGMKRYVAYLKSKSKDGIVAHGLGDWYDIGPGGPGPSKLTSNGLTSTAIYYQDLIILKETAMLLNQPDQSRQFGEEAATVKAAFNKTFFNSEKNQYDRNSQTANAMPLVLGLVPEDRRTAVLDGLVNQIRAGGNKVTAGDVGFNYLMRALSDGGRGDVLYDMLVRDDGPGYAYQLKKGATSLTEAWDTNPGSSQNHCMLGHIEEWFYRGLGGISFDPAGPGFKKIIIHPQTPGDLNEVNTTYESPYGTIVSHWKREGDKLTMNITIPANTTATIYVPAENAASVLENGKAAEQSNGVRFLRKENSHSIYAVGSGSYHFKSSLGTQFQK